jgi:hypothetical protein
MRLETLVRLGDRGGFYFAAPFDNWNGLLLEVESLTDINNMQLLYPNILKEIYEGNNIPRSITEKALVDSMTIVGFFTTNRTMLYVPADYIISAPRIDGVLYQGVALAVGIGSLPSTEVYEALIAEIDKRVRATLGVDPVIKVVNTDWGTFVSHSEHDASLARREMVKHLLPPIENTQTLKGRINELEQRVKMLESYLLNIGEYAHNSDCTFGGIFAPLHRPGTVMEEAYHNILSHALSLDPYNLSLHAGIKQE